MADQRAKRGMSGLPEPLRRPDMSAREAFAAFVGGWQMVVGTIFRRDGATYHPYGVDGVGQIMYSADGHMSCHIMRANREPYGQPGVYQVSEEQLGRSMREYSGYFGRFSIDAEAGVITHHVAGAWYPDWLGSDQPRRYAFDGDRLFLEGETGDGMVRIEWRRVVTDVARQFSTQLE